MPSSYSTRLRFELIGPSEYGLSGNWGATTNINLGTLIEEAIAGLATVTVNAATDTTLTTANGSTDQARNIFVDLTGTMTQANNIICPSVQKVYFVRNSTTGGFSVTFKTAAGTGITILNGRTRALYCNGTNVIDLLNDLPSGTLVGGVEAVTLSGTQTLTNKTLTSPRIGTTILDSNGAEAIRIAATAAAVNEIQVVNAATTGTPSILATGDDANIGINLIGKGTGQIFANSVAVVTLSGTQTLTNKTLTSPTINTPVSVSPRITNGLFDVNANEMLSFVPAVSAVNEISIANAATLGSPAISAIGGDANVSLNLVPKGTGTINIAGVPAVTTTGTQTLTNKTIDSPTINTATSVSPRVTNGLFDVNANEVILFTPTGSAVNEITVANAATLNSPTISATGGDPNISINLVPKGTGSINIAGIPAVTTSGTQTLTNKTLTSPAINNPSITNTGAITLPAGPDTLVGRNTTDTLTNKTLDNSNILTLRDDRLTIQDNADTTKQVVFEASNIASATTRTLTLPNTNGSFLVGTSVTSQTTSYTALVTDRVINFSGLAADVTLTLPTAASFGTGQMLYIRNSDTAFGVIIDPNGAETLDGATTRRTNGPNTVVIMSTGTNWVTIGGVYRYVSPEVSISSGASFGGAHGLGVMPYVVSAIMVCKTADAGYAVGDRVYIPGYPHGAGNTQTGCTVGANTTNAFGIISASNTVNLIHKTTGSYNAATTANWRIVVECLAS